VKSTNYNSIAHAEHLSFALDLTITLNVRQSKSWNSNYAFPMSNNCLMPQQHRKQMTLSHTKQNTFLAYFVVSNAIWSFTFSQLHLLRQFGIIFAKKTKKQKTKNAKAAL